MESEQSLLGKKVFFLNPPPVVEEIMALLVRREFEVYPARDHLRLERYLASIEPALLFVNIDEGQPEPAWCAWIESLRSNPKTAKHGVGIVSFNDRPELREKYLMDFGLPCGYVLLKIGAMACADVLMKTLEANEARGRRKYVRVTCEPGNAECAIPTKDGTLHTDILDISSVGAAILFHTLQVPNVGEVLKAVQLSLKGTRVFLDAIIVARRDDDPRGPMRVLLFDPKSLDDTRKEKVHAIVQRAMINEMDKALSQV